MREILVLRRAGDRAGPYVIIKAAVVGDLTFARTSYRSIHGPIASDWRIENGVKRRQVTIPPGTTATVYWGGSAHEVGSGRFEFTAK